MESLDAAARSNLPPHPVQPHRRAGNWPEVAAIYKARSQKNCRARASLASLGIGPARQAERPPYKGCRFLRKGLTWRVTSRGIPTEDLEPAETLFRLGSIPPLSDLLPEG